MNSNGNPKDSELEILVVEDSPTQAERLKYFLERKGFHVALAYNGEEALSYLAMQHKPAMVISDIMMPGMDGFQLCQRIKENDTLSEIPVILLTSLSDPEDIIKGLKCGATNFITKPYNELFLLSRIKHILVNQELRKSSSTEMGIEIIFAGERHFLTAERMQIIDLLISTYETAVEKNRELEQANEELRKTQYALKQLNEHLEEKVKERTQRIEHLNTFLHAIRSINRLIVREDDRQRLIQGACDNLFAIRNDFCVWIVLLGESPEVVTTAEAGFGSDFLPIVEGLRQGDWPGCMRKALAEPGMLRIEHTLSSCPECPLISRDNSRGVMVAKLEYAGKLYGFIAVSMPAVFVRDQEEQSLFEEVVEDISFALHGIEVNAQRQRAEEGLKQSLEKLTQTLRGTVTILSDTIEKRDPYTAGHQKRVAILARAMAREMGLSENQQDGIFMAGTIHDLGKISIPAEILSKPARLTEIELKIIEAHPQVGYDIVKGVEFPWPLAEILRQHHERMNGSGYPLGLSGEKIHLKARILAVADVVEAMASHRPYRPGLGIDKALEEISENRGVLYDPGAVDACLKVFARGEFVFQ